MCVPGHPAGFIVAVVGFPFVVGMVKCLLQGVDHLTFAFGILEHINIFGDALGIGIVAHHLGGKINELTGVEPTAVCVKMVEQLSGSEVCVEGMHMMEIAVPNSVDHVMDELSSGTSVGIIGRINLDKNHVFSLAVGTDDGRDIIINGQIGRWVIWPGEVAPPCCSVRSSGLDEPMRL